MILQYTSGCISDSLTIDGKETIDIPIEDIRKVLHKLIDIEDDLGTLQEIYISLLSAQGKYECSSKPCECCGDYVTTYKLEI